MTRQRWERRKKETQKAWEAFIIYRDSGLKRSHVKVGQELGKSLALMSRWSKRHQWVARCKAYDAFLDEKRVESTVDGIQLMNCHHFE